MNWEDLLDGEDDNGASGSGEKKNDAKRDKPRRKANGGNNGKGKVGESGDTPSGRKFSDSRDMGRKADADNKGVGGDTVKIPDVGVGNIPQIEAPKEESDFEEFDASAYEWEEPGRGGKKRTAGLSGEDAEELVELGLRAQRAQLMQEINKELLQQRKIEQETLKLEKEAGEVMELSFAEFLFLGYIEKANIDFCGMTKKLKSQIVSLATEKDGAGIVRLIEKEVTSILKTIKRNQKRDLTAWKRENARARSGSRSGGKKKGEGK